MKVLVTAASRHGATEEIAEWVAATLRARGQDAVALPPAQVTSLSGYGAVVLGSALYLGGWLKEATSFGDRFLGELADRRVWLFSSGPVGDPLLPADQPVKLGGLMARTGALEHRVFAGSLDTGALGVRERIAVRAIGVGAGDYRDRDAIAQWASTIADVLDRDAVTAG